MTKLRRQSGNVIPYVLALLLAVALSGQYVFNSYKVSNESTRLQNTSDAAAYSVATVYAQNQNYISLSNRALVANQVTMAQVVTMVSWSRLLDTTATTVNSIGQYIPYVNVVTRYIETTADWINRVIERIAPPLTSVIQTYIVATSQLQEIVVASVALISQGILEEVVSENDPDINYSFAAIDTGRSTVAHISSLYGQNDCRRQADRVRQGAANVNSETIARCRQFRNVTLESLDGFTQNRTYRFSFPGMPSSIPIPGLSAELVPGVPIYSTLTIERAGGTTMSGDTPGTINSTPFTTWTAIDTISLHSSTRYIAMTRRGPRIRSTEHQERAKLGVAHAYVGNECSRCHHLVHEGTPYWNVNPRGSACTDPDRDRQYGGGRRSWNDGAFILMDVFSLNCRQLSDRYGQSINDRNMGLTDFYNLQQEGYVEEKDRVMTYLRKDRRDVETASEAINIQSSGMRLDANDGAQNDVLHGVAAAAVYFRRGNDNWMLPSARRLDGRLEFGNAYNPFWSARLTKMSNGQRTSMLLMKRL